MRPCVQSPVLQRKKRRDSRSFAFQWILGISLNTRGLMFNIEKSLPLLIIHVEMAIGQNSDQ
jgi:hypothetical protein